MNDMPTEPILVTNQLQSKAGFAVKQNTIEQVYIPASIGLACDIEIGRVYEAVLAPNHHDKSDSTPWMAIRIVTGDTAPKPVEDFSDVSQALSEAEYPLSAEEAGVLRHRLERAWRAGKVVKVEARQSPQDEPKVLWTLDMELV